jgi:hypothetical protein
MIILELSEGIYSLTKMEKVYEDLISLRPRSSTLHITLDFIGKEKKANTPLGWHFIHVWYFSNVCIVNQVDNS